MRCSRPTQTPHALMRMQGDFVQSTEALRATMEEEADAGGGRGRGGRIESPQEIERAQK